MEVHRKACGVALSVRPTAPAGGASTMVFHTSRKLWSHPRDQRWHDKQYKKVHLGRALKAGQSFGGTSHAKGIILGKGGVKAEQPNTAFRKYVRVQMIKNGKINKF